METEIRVAKLEAAVESIDRSVADLRADFRDLRTEMRTEIADLRSEMRTELGNVRIEMRTELGDVRSEMRELRSQARGDFRILFGALMTLGIGLAGLMARGFGWL